jgi:phosphoribosylamine--glycine ligase
MKILVVGSGGREHALVWKIARSPQVKKIYCAPGNPGIVDLAECVNIKAGDHKALLDFARQKGIDLTVIGPEDPLVAGIVNTFSQAGLNIFGPTGQAANLEGSKEFAKKLMQKHNIPTAACHTFSSLRKAKSYLETVSEFPVVLKASGLAAGKGVLICESRNDAQKGLTDLMDRKIFGPAGDVIVIEEFLRGEEVSIFTITDGSDYLLLSSAQDHKKALDGDRGKNTGGMGAYAPAPVADDRFMKTVHEQIIEPTLRAMRNTGSPFKGLLYFGLMITEKGPKVLEYNVRFGDPETEVVLPLLKNDLIALMMAAINGTIRQEKIVVHPGYAFDVVIASGGYPGTYEKGKVIYGLDKIDPEILVFHAGTAVHNDDLVTNGGRVLNIVAVDESFDRARQKVYTNIEKLNFDDMHYRTDIGFRAIKRLNPLDAG